MTFNNIIIRDYEEADYEQVRQLWEETDLEGTARGDTNEVVLETIKAGGRLIILEDKSIINPVI